MNLTEPKIICIMPCYNAEKTLAMAIESVTKQNYTNWKLIIVDDASTDKSVNVAKKYLKDSRITLLQNKTNRGCYYSRNRALYHVKDQEWDWFTVHDADDTSHPDRFSIYMAYSFHGSYDYLYSCGSGNRFNFTKQKLEYVKKDSFVGIAWISKRLFDQIGYFDSTTRFSGDSEYEHRNLVIITSIFGTKLNTNDISEVEKYCFSNKIALGKLDISYSYLYTCGFTPGQNLTQIVSSKERLEYRNTFENKWGKGEILIDDFYIPFTPEQEDL